MKRYQAYEALWWLQELQRVNQQQLAALRQLSQEQDGRKAELEAQLKAEYDAKVEETRAQLAGLSESMERQEVREGVWSV